MKTFISTALVAIALGGLYTARAQDNEITVIAPGGIRGALEQLFPGFEQKTGHKVKATFGGAPATRQQVVKGDPVDVPIMQTPFADVLASGNVVQSSAMPLASVSVGIAVRKGAPKPDISTVDAAKRTLLAAASLAFPTPTGGAGVAVAEALGKLGIADQIASKSKTTMGGPAAMAMVAKGDVEIGLTLLSEITDPGVDVIGPLPKEVATPLVLVGFISSHAKDPAAAKMLLDYLSTPEAAAAYKTARMEPGAPR